MVPNSEQRKLYNRDKMRRWRLANPDKVAAARINSVYRNPEYSRKKRQRLIDRIGKESVLRLQRERVKKSRNSNLERARAWDKQWREANWGRIREQRRARREQNIDAVREYFRIHRRNNPQMYNEATKRYWQANPEKLRAKMRRGSSLRYSKQRIAPGKFTDENVLLRVEYHGWKCIYCKTGLTAETLTIDHMIPLVRGGSNWPSNLAPACKSCNCKKNKKTFFEYQAIIGSC